MSGVSVSFIGGGAMAQAIAGGILDSKSLDSGSIHASATSNRFESWWTSRNMSFTTNNTECLNKSNVIVLAVKPHLYSDAIRTLADQGVRVKDKLWVSIMAGVTLEDLQAAIFTISSDTEDRVVRTIPNTPCKVREGSVAVTYNPACNKEDRDIVEKIFSGVARVTEIPERLQNAFAAMAGSGPAYIYQVIEAMADGGVMMGLPRALAVEHAAATVRGAATMVLQESDKHSAQLKDEVCSPGGSTIRGVHKLEEGGVRIAFMNAIQAACNRNEELGKK